MSKVFHHLNNSGINHIAIHSLSHKFCHSSWPRFFAGCNIAHVYDATTTTHYGQPQTRSMRGFTSKLVDRSIILDNKEAMKQLLKLTISDSIQPYDADNTTPTKT